VKIAFRAEIGTAISVLKEKRIGRTSNWQTLTVVNKNTTQERWYGVMRIFLKNRARQ